MFYLRQIRTISLKDQPDTYSLAVDKTKVLWKIIKASRNAIRRRWVEVRWTLTNLENVYNIAIVASTSSEKPPNVFDWIPIKCCVIKYGASKNGRPTLHLLMYIHFLFTIMSTSSLYRKRKPSEGIVTTHQEKSATSSTHQHSNMASMLEGHQTNGHKALPLHFHIAATINPNTGQ